MSLQSVAKQPRSSPTASQQAGRWCILTINSGSSSLKFALGARPARLLSGRVERVGMPFFRSIHEGGELGYSLSHAFGAAFDNPELIVACVRHGRSQTN
jgi:hypothetical protein